MASPKVKVVTGFVPLPGYPRPADEWGRLIESLGNVLLQRPEMPRHMYLQRLEEMWFLDHVARWSKKAKKPPIVHHSDNPQKNTLAYHAIQHQKFYWLAKEAKDFPELDTVVWIDAGIMHVPGVTATVILDFLDRIKKDDFAIPGCWSQDDMRITDAHPNWRFCGGVMVVPREVAVGLLLAVQQAVKAHLKLTGSVTWEVNSLASAEKAGTIKPRWYEADHSELLFTRY